MSDIPVEYTCPLGHTCEKVVEDRIERCMCYVEIQGQDPLTGEPVKGRHCAFSFNVIATLESARTNRGQTAAICSFRDEMVKGNSNFLSLLSGAKALEDANDTD